MTDDKAKYALLDRIQARGVATLVGNIKTLSDKEIAALQDDHKMGLSFIGDLLAERGVPNGFILHRMSEITIKETLLEAVQTEAELDHVAAADDELDATLDVLTKEPSDEVIAFYEKKIHEMGTPQKDVLHMAIEAENEREL